MAGDVGSREVQFSSDVQHLKDKSRRWPEANAEFYNAREAGLRCIVRIPRLSPTPTLDQFSRQISVSVAFQTYLLFRLILARWICLSTHL